MGSDEVYLDQQIKKKITIPYYPHHETHEAGGGDEVAGLTDSLISNPPSGGYKILNIWRNADGNLEYEYEDVPIP